MARSSERDPLDKFRFKLIVLQNSNYSPTSKISIKENNSSEFYSGFTSITSPKVTINEIKYRENMYGSYTKKPGIPNYEPITLYRGVTLENQFYMWLRKVTEPVLDLNSAMKALSGGFGIQPPVNTQAYDFRKDIVIACLDRTGKEVKYWFLFECFPTALRAGNDFQSNADEKLIEELTLTYECFIEITANDLASAIQKINDMSSEAFNNAVRASAINTATSILPF